MNGERETKICPMCAETIKAAAKVCPFCQSRQRRWVLWSYDALSLLPLAVVLAIVLIVLRPLMPENRARGSRFSNHRGDLIVLEPVLIGSGSNAPVWLIGSVTNQGTTPWRIQELETLLVDTNGRVLDVQHSSLAEPFVAMPGREHAFKVRVGTPNFAVSQLAPRVRVQIATDGNLPPKAE